MREEADPYFRVSFFIFNRKKNHSQGSSDHSQVKMERP